MNERRENLTGAELRAKSFFERSNNFSAEIGDLRVRQRCVAALEGNAHEQRIFSGRNIFAAEKIRRFDGVNFLDAESLNRSDHVGKLRAIGKEQ